MPISMSSPEKPAANDVTGSFVSTFWEAKNPLTAELFADGVSALLAGGFAFSLSLAEVTVADGFRKFRMSAFLRIGGGGVFAFGFFRFGVAEPFVVPAGLSSFRSCSINFIDSMSPPAESWNYFNRYD